MNKKIMKEALLATILDIIFIISIVLLNEKHCNVILILSNVIVGCTVKAAGFWNDLVADNGHTHLGKRFEVSAFALGLFVIAALIMLWAGIWFVLYTGIGLFVVFIYDWIAYFLFKTYAHSRKKKKIKA
ncbi:MULTISPECIES: hypothetical protein [Ruminococcus]|uniref:Uncharacterized protein n=1 Tax=Ruminococcus flavefaciens TaxID=1265 RepID=A0A1M7LFH0_RUMFL|nr:MULTISPECIES: hypothetical protein [Ruminococcus]MCR4796648.1 hypothetical protein [Ruminococcus sp.]SHM76680.1 hypothetical protein SAMN04487860_11332 [Ruminococcus flavefaciens]